MNIIWTKIKENMIWVVSGLVGALYLVKLYLTTRQSEVVLNENKEVLETINSIDIDKQKLNAQLQDEEAKRRALAAQLNEPKGLTDEELANYFNNRK